MPSCWFVDFVEDPSSERLQPLNFELSMLGFAGLLGFAVATGSVKEAGGTLQGFA
jgi:hypothetical protein